MVEDGYEFFAKRQLVTLFSAPNYCGEFDNAGAMMSVDETLMCSFQVCKNRAPVWMYLYVCEYFANKYQTIIIHNYNCFVCILPKLLCFRCSVFVFTGLISFICHNRD